MIDGRHAFMKVQIRAANQIASQFYFNNANSIQQTIPYQLRRLRRQRKRNRKLRTR